MIYYQLYKTASIFRNGLGILDASSELTNDEIDKNIGYKTVFSLDNPFDKNEEKCHNSSNYNKDKLIINIL